MPQTGLLQTGPHVVGAQPQADPRGVIRRTPPRDSRPDASYRTRRAPC